MYNFWINKNFSPLSVQCALKKAHDKPGKKWPDTRLVPHWKLKREIAMPATNSHFPERSEVKWPPTYEILIKSLPHLVGWKTEKECSTNVASKTKGESQQMLHLLLFIYHKYQRYRERSSKEYLLASASCTVIQAIGRLEVEDSL